MKFIVGKKIGMTTLHDAQRGAQNVTLIACGENTVSGKRTTERDGYLAVQVKTPKTKRRIETREFRLDKRLTAEKAAALLDACALGQVLDVSRFQVGERVTITGVTKAKGFQGVVKRHGFKGAPASHGRKHDMRKPGSIGAAFPEHVVKGRRMGGRMGGVRHTTRNLQVVMIDASQHLLAVRGAVPGVAGRLVSVISIEE